MRLKPRARILDLCCGTGLSTRALLETSAGDNDSEALSGNYHWVWRDVDDLRTAAMIERYKPVERPGAKHHDLVLITIDTVRYDHTPLGGGASRPE